LFEGVCFSGIRYDFHARVGRTYLFSFETLEVESLHVCKELVAAGRNIFDALKRASSET
jgi:hypothetical protein